MRVLFLQRQPCIRALKYAVGLRAAEPGIALGFSYQGRTLTGWYGTGDELFDGWWPLGRDAGRDLAEVVERFRPDLIHSHNLPDSLSVAALALGPGRPPVIHDAHDLQCLRRTPYEDGFEDPEDPLALEREAVEGADGLVMVSDQMEVELAARYRLPVRRLTFPNLALRRDLPARLPPPERPAGRPPRVVYQGSLSANGSHYDLREAFRAAAAEGLRVHVHPNRDAPAYVALAAEQPGIVVHERLAPAELMQVLPRYDLGWAIFNDALNARHLDTALPNKLFEYLGAGLPVLAGPHAALSGFVAEHGVGVAVEGAAGLRTRVDALDLVALRRRVADLRETLTVEAGIGSLVALYSGVAEGHRAAEPLVRH